MYLHLGQSMVVPYHDIIGIFDLDNASSSHITRKYLEQAEKNGRVVNVSDDLPKSFVICTSQIKGSVVYLSQLSAATLLRRVENNTFEWAYL